LQNDCGGIADVVGLRMRTMEDAVLLLHPAIAICTIFPVLGIITQLALKVRKRRIDKDKTVSAEVGREHVLIGKILTGASVGIALLALANDIGNALIASSDGIKIGFVVLMFVATIAVLVCLYRAKSKVWRSIFASLTGMGLVVLGCQNGVYRNTEHWYVSHYYYGVTAAFLMIFALSILPEIYRSKRWRIVHIVLNSVALLIFVGQSVTGVRSLLEIPLHWQEPYVQELYEQKCEIRKCAIEAK
jgi:zinc transporter ZupT